MGKSFLNYAFIFMLSVGFYQLGFSQNQREITLEKAQNSLDQTNWLEAKAILDPWIQSYPKDTTALFLRGQASQKLNEWEAALSDLNTLLTISPKNREGLFERGRIRYQLNQFEPAMDDFYAFIQAPIGETNRVMYQISPNGGVTGVTTLQSTNEDLGYYHLGLCAIALEDYELAIDYLSAALEIRDDDPDFYTQLGIAFGRLGENIQAIQAFETALLLDPNHLRAKEGLANVQTGGDQVLIAQLEQTIADSAANSQTYKQRGFYRMSHQENESAISDFDQAIALDSMDVENYYYRGLIYSRLKEWEKSEDDYSRALELSPQDPEIYLARGQTRYRNAKLSEAFADFTQVVSLDPEHASGYYHQGITLQRMGKIKEACLVLQRSIDLGMEAAQTVFDKICSGN